MTNNNDFNGQIPVMKSKWLNFQVPPHCAVNLSDPNLRMNPLDGENLPQSPRIVKSGQDDAEDGSDQVKPMIYFDTGDLVRRTFLMEEDDDGLCYRAHIIEVLDGHEKNVANNPILKKFKFSLCLRDDMGFFPSPADPCIWMRQADNHYQYIVVYVDDLVIAAKCPAGIIQALTEDYKFKLKGTGLIKVPFGMRFIS
jgi:hypothetical protein